MARRRDRRDPATRYANDVLGLLYPETPFRETFPNVAKLDLLIEEFEYAREPISSQRFDETNAGAPVRCSRVKCPPPGATRARATRLRSTWSSEVVGSLFSYAAFSVKLTSKPSASIRRASRFASTAGS
jgi:hypothetical protein